MKISVIEKRSSKASSNTDVASDKKMERTLFLETLVFRLIEVFTHYRVLEFHWFVNHERFVALPRYDIAESPFLCFIQDYVDF